jgi:translation initiation factor IF-3
MVSHTTHNTVRQSGRHARLLLIGAQTRLTESAVVFSDGKRDFGQLSSCVGFNLRACGKYPGLTERSKSIERNQRINEQIRISPVRVVAANGDLLGILNTDEALARAREADLDLVEVAPNERPPVCRIMDYGKFKYQQKKRQSKGHTHQSKIKEIRVRPKTGEHDIGFKLNQARQFLAHKDKVVVSVIFRGREMAHIEEGRKVIDHIVQDLQDVGKIESAPSHQGKRIVCILTPK